MNESPSFPYPSRDESKLLLYRDGKVSESVFKHITDYLPEGSLMVFNNTRVIQARLLFQRATGAQIEVFCLDPAAPHDYELIFQQTEACNWICLIGNAKNGKSRFFPEITVAGQTVRLSAEKCRVTERRIRYVSVGMAVSALPKYWMLRENFRYLRIFTGKRKKVI